MRGYAVITFRLKGDQKEEQAYAGAGAQEDL